MRTLFVICTVMCLARALNAEALDGKTAGTNKCVDGRNSKNQHMLTNYFVVVDPKAKVYEEPSQTAKVLKKLQAGEVLRVMESNDKTTLIALQTQNDFVKVIYSKFEQVGWVLLHSVIAAAWAMSKEDLEDVILSDADKRMKLFRDSAPLLSPFRRNKYTTSEETSQTLLYAYYLQKFSFVIVQNLRVYRLRFPEDLSLLLKTVTKRASFSEGFLTKAVQFCPEVIQVKD